MQLDRVTGDMCYVHVKLPDIPADEREMADETAAETPEPCEWINLGCGDTERKKKDLSRFSPHFGRVEVAIGRKVPCVNYVMCGR